MPFARVARHRMFQSNSSSHTSAVHELALDTNFSAVTPSKHGNVHFSIQGMKGNANMGSPSSNSGGHRRMSSHASLGDKIDRRNVFAHGLNAPRNLGKFNKTLPLDSIPVNFSGVKTLLNTSIGNSASTANPTSLDGSVSLDVGADVHASISLGAVAAGSLIPPTITEFGLYFVMDGTVDAKLSVTANITGQVDSGSITLFKIGIPGLSFPGILELSPDFKVMGHIDANFGKDSVNAVVDLNYNLSGLSYIFPPQGEQSMPGTKHGGVTISANPDTCGPFDATGHLIPQVDIGLSALGGIVSTGVFLNLDASADFSMYNSTTSAQSCVSASTNFNASVGAHGSFFNRFNASVGASVFDKDFPLFQKCFATAS